MAENCAGKLLTVADDVRGEKTAGSGRFSLVTDSLMLISSFNHSL